METCLPPRSLTRRPNLVVPDLACDCHCHIVGPPSEYPLTPDRSFNPALALHEDYLRMLSSLGFKRTVVVQPSVYGFDNRQTVAAVAKLGTERARGVAMVSEDISDEALGYLNAAGIRATRFITTVAGGPGIGRLADVGRRVADVGWHVEMYLSAHLWPGVLPTVESLAVPVVLDHMAGLSADMSRNDPDVLKALLRLLRSGQCWVKLSGYRASVAGNPYSDVAALAKLLVAEAPEQCVWGTDWPHFNMPGYMPDDADLLDLLEDWIPDTATRRAILVDNPARLYGFS